MANVDLIVSVLEKEKHGLCSGGLIEITGERWRGPCCFIGALLYAAGYTPRRLRGLDNYLEVPERWSEKREYYIQDTNSKEYRARKVLKEVYDLTDAQIDVAMNLNDEFVTNEEDYSDESHQLLCNIERRDYMIMWVKDNWR